MKNIPLDKKQEKRLIQIRDKTNRQAVIKINSILENDLFYQTLIKIKKNTENKNG
jgi:hypothetical protein